MKQTASLALDTWVTSTAGLYRASNQDSAFASDRVAFVADGVGGHAAGDMASSVVTARIGAVIEGSRRELFPPDLVRSYLASGNSEIAFRVSRDPTLFGMATTFTGIFCDQDHLTLAHTGDSRAYRLRDGKLKQVTRDDSYVQTLIDSGQISEDDARSSPYRSVVTAILAGDISDVTEMPVVSLKSQPGDRWLIASDGLSDYVPLDAIESALMFCDSPRECSTQLTQTALTADSRDNITVIVADVVDDVVANGESGYHGAVQDLYPAFDRLG
jgi:serine/threonine protein phosphatase PrpC